MRNHNHVPGYSAVRLLSLVIIVLTSSLLMACLFTPTYIESMRVTSPDGIADAVMLEGNGGAPAPMCYKLFIVPKGEKFTKSNKYFKDKVAILFAENIVDLKLNWRSSGFLEVRYNRARIQCFTNEYTCWNDFSYYSEIRLMPPENAISAYDCEGKIGTIK